MKTHSRFLWFAYVGLAVVAVACATPYPGAVTDLASRIKSSRTIVVSCPACTDYMNEDIKKVLGSMGLTSISDKGADLSLQIEGKFRIVSHQYVPKDQPQSRNPISMATGTAFEGVLELKDQQQQLILKRDFYGQWWPQTIGEWRMPEEETIRQVAYWRGLQCTLLEIGRYVEATTAGSEKYRKCQ